MPARLFKTSVQRPKAARYALRCALQSQSQPRPLPRREALQRQLEETDDANLR